MTTPAGAVAANARSAQREAEGREKSAPKSDGFFQKKYGPLPGWGWAAVAAGGALVYFFWRNRKAATSAASTAATVTGVSTTQATSSTGYAGSIAALQNEVAALQGQLSTTPGTAATTSKSTGPGTGTAKTTSKTTNPTTAAKTSTPVTQPPGPQVKVPNVTGMRANQAIGELTSLGFRYKGTTNRNPSKTYAVASQSPSGGTSAAKGSTVTLSWVQHNY